MSSPNGMRHTRYSKLASDIDGTDKTEGLTSHSFTYEVPELLTEYRDALLKCVAALPNTADRLVFLAGTTDLFRKIYETSDTYTTTPIQNSFQTIRYGVVERISSTEAEREANGLFGSERGVGVWWYPGRGTGALRV